MREAMEFIFRNGQYTFDTLVSLATFAAEGNLLLQNQNWEPLRKGLWNTVSNLLHRVEHASSNSARVL